MLTWVPSQLSSEDFVPLLSLYLLQEIYSSRDSASLKRSKYPSRCYFHNPSITTSLVFTVYMGKPPACQGPSVGMLHRALTLTLQKKPLEVHYGGAIFTTGHIRYGNIPSHLLSNSWSPDV